MESLSQKKIELYVDRPFGVRFNAAIDFIKLHIRVLLKILACFILPICVIDATFINTLVNRITVARDLSALDVVFILLLLLLLVVSSVISLAITFGLFKAYEDNPEGARRMTIKEFVPYLRGGIRRGIGLFFFLFFVYFVMMIIFVPMAFIPVIGSVISLLQYPISFAMSPVILIPVVYYLENKGIIESTKRAFALGFKTFWSLVGMYIIIEVISSFVTVFALVPYAIVIVMDIVALSKSFEAGTWGLVFVNFGMFVFGILFVFVYHFIAIITSYAAVYHYGYAVEHLEHVSVVADVENFEKMSDNSLDAPESISENLNDVDNFENL